MQRSDARGTASSSPRHPGRLASVATPSTRNAVHGLRALSPLGTPVQPVSPSSDDVDGDLDLGALVPQGQPETPGMAALARLQSQREHGAAVAVAGSSSDDDASSRDGRPLALRVDSLLSTMSERSAPSIVSHMSLARTASLDAALESQGALGGVRGGVGTLHDGDGTKPSAFGDWMACRLVDYYFVAGAAANHVQHAVCSMVASARRAAGDHSAAAAGAGDSAATDESTQPNSASADADADAGAGAGAGAGASGSNGSGDADAGDSDGGGGDGSGGGDGGGSGDGSGDSAGDGRDGGVGSGGAAAKVAVSAVPGGDGTDQGTGLPQPASTSPSIPDPAASSATAGVSDGDAQAANTAAKKDPPVPYLDIADSPRASTDAEAPSFDTGSSYSPTATLSLRAREGALRWWRRSKNMLAGTDDASDTDATLEADTPGDSDGVATANGSDGGDDGAGQGVEAEASPRRVQERRTSGGTPGWNEGVLMDRYPSWDHADLPFPEKAEWFCLPSKLACVYVCGCVCVWLCVCGCACPSTWVL